MDIRNFFAPKSNQASNGANARSSVEAKSNTSSKASTPQKSSSRKSSSSLPTPAASSPKASPAPRSKTLVVSDDDDNFEFGLTKATKSKSPATKKAASRKSIVLSDDGEDDDDFVVESARSSQASTSPSPKKIHSSKPPPEANASASKPLTPSKRAANRLDDVASPEPVAKKKFDYAKMKNRQAGVVRAPGSKPIPEGAENCLQGLTFVFTGDLSSLSRETAGDLIKRYAGGKTSYLIVGEDPGATKLAKAKSLKLKTLDEDGFLALIASSKPAQNANPDSSRQDDSSPVNADEKSKSKPMEASTITPDASQMGKETRLWTEKYAPTSYNDVIGNRSLIDKLAVWLRDWKRNNQGSAKKSGKDDSAFKAALLSGPPGLGKTTAAHLVAKTEGFELIEFNASDTRNKKSLDLVMREATANHTLSQYFSSGLVGSAKSSGAPVRNHVIVMDEVDGMSAGDRGGSAELIQIIKKTKIPIICICNDRSSPKIRTLANYCADMRFRRPTSQQVEARLSKIATMENLELKPNALAELVASTSGDIRQIINLLSTYALSNSSLSYDQSKNMGKTAEKDVAVNIFDVIMRLLGGSGYRSMTLAQKLDCYFQDYSLTPLFLQENYIRVRPNVPPSSTRHPDVEALDRLELAANSISESDLLETQIRRENDWSLLNTHGMMSTVRPCYFMHGAMSGMLQFPGWLGQYSKGAKRDRLLFELHAKLKLKASGDKHELRMNYFPMLLQRLVLPLVRVGADAIEDVIKVMDDYYVAKEDWDGLVELGLGKADMGILLPKIASNVKSSFTRIYNKGSHPIPFVAKLGPKMFGRAAGRESGPAPDLEEVGEVDEDEAEEDDMEGDGEGNDEVVDKLVKEVKPKGKRAASASGTSKAKTAAPKKRAKKERS